MRTCPLDGCESKHRTRGYCRIHYNRWRNMIGRCTNPNHQDYKNYGGRGIFVCLSWSENPDNYYGDIGSAAFEGATVDRPNNNGGYTCGHCKECIENCWPSNWRWASKTQQRNNQRLQGPRPHPRYPDCPTGTTKHGNKFRAQISIGGRQTYLGMFNTPEEAHEAFLKAKQEA